MSVTELIPEVQHLSRADKFRLMQFLVVELAAAENALIEPNTEYPIWSPYDAFEAAEKMLTKLSEGKASYG